MNSALDGTASLVERARAGDSRAFERIYRDNVGRVNAVCVRLTRDRALAEDCTQEAFIRAWRALAGFESRSNLATWLHRIAVNVVLETRRKPDRRLEFVKELPPPGEHEVALDTPCEEAELEAAIGGLPDGARVIARAAGGRLCMNESNSNPPNSNPPKMNRLSELPQQLAPARDLWSGIALALVAACASSVRSVAT